MQMLPGPERGRLTAVLLLVIAVAVVYFGAVHWWFTARHIEIAAEMSGLREQEARFRRIAEQRQAVEARLAEVWQFEAGNPAFLSETDFDSAAAGLTQRLKQIVGQHARDAQSCQIIMNQYSRPTEKELFARYQAVTACAWRARSACFQVASAQSASNCVFKPTAQPPLSQSASPRMRGGLTRRCTPRIQFRVFGNSSREWSMASLRSESRATRCCASSLRAGAVIARSFSKSRARSLRRSVVRLSGRGPRVSTACRSVPSARAVPGCIASILCPAYAGARPVRFVGVASARRPLHPGGKVAAPGVLSRHNYVFSRTAGDGPALNRPLLARGRLTRR